MLRKIRVTLAILFFAAVTLLFLDFTGTIHAWLGWVAKVQFLPALLALNTGVVIALVLLTLLLGRVYCSVICPLGVFQDVVSWLSARRRKKKYRFTYSRPLTWLRWTVLVLFVAAMLAGVGSFVALLDPYSAYGRMASNLLAPLYGWGNNALAWMAERMDSYAFYDTTVWLRSLPTFIIAIVTLVVIVVFCVHSQKYIRSVADFLAAGRTGGRYLLSSANGMAGMGLITLAVALQNYRHAGWAVSWWGQIITVVATILSLSGFVFYRYRQTRVLTLAQFFEIRYCRSFRVVMGILCWLSGVINFGIFPAVGAHFFIAFLGLPREINGIPLYPILMILFLGSAAAITRRPKISRVSLYAPQLLRLYISGYIGSVAFIYASRFSFVIP